MIIGQGLTDTKWNGWLCLDIKLRFSSIEGR